MEGSFSNNPPLQQISCEIKVLLSSEPQNKQHPKLSEISLYQQMLIIRATGDYVKTHSFQFQTKAFHNSQLSSDKKTACLIFEVKPKIMANVQMQNFVPENFQLMVQKIKQIKQSKQINHEIKLQTPQEQKLLLTRKKKPIIQQTDAEENGPEKLSIQEFNLHPNSSKQDSHKMIALSKKVVPVVSLADLPPDSLDKIFMYCGDLRARLVSKRFSEFVLYNIQSIRLQSKISQKAFNKLAMWAINLECQMTYVKTIELKDRFENGELIKNRAKTLRFGEWKKITKKNLDQIKGLKTYCLELPYLMKPQLSVLFNQRMVQLRLKGPANVRNQSIKDDDILFLVNNTIELRVLQVPFCTSRLITEIKNPGNIEELLFQTRMTFHKKENGQTFRAFLTQKQRNRQKFQSHQINMVFPDGLGWLGIGSFISMRNLEKLPLHLKYLKLVGEFYNQHLQNINLLNMKQLDVSDCKNIRPEAIQLMENIKLVTSWKGSTIDNIKKYALARKIEVTTILKHYS